MKKKGVMIFMACVLLTTSFSARGIFNLAFRAGCFYVCYKFVDGMTECSISNFVHQYKDGVVNGICSFGKGVERLGLGVREVAGAYWYDRSEEASSVAGKGLKRHFEAACSAMYAEWKVRSKATKTAKQEFLSANALNKSEPPEKEPKEQLAKARRKPGSTAS